MSLEGNTWLTQVIYALIVILAFSGNALVLYVLITRPSYLKHPYNIFIFSLAVVDIFTAVFLVFSRSLFLPPIPDGHVAREIYCRIIWPSVIPFCLGFISIYTAVALTVERWLAVVKPLVYRSIKPHLAVKAVVFVWIWGSLINLATVFRVKFDEVKQRCTWTSLNIANDELTWLDFTLQSVIPFLAIILLYCHILHAMRKLTYTSGTRHESIKKVTTVALVASSAMIIGWLPSRITFMMSKVGIVDANGLLHHCLTMLAFSNICVNPFLYGIYSSQFRREYKVILRKFLANI